MKKTTAELLIGVGIGLMILGLILYSFPIKLPDNNIYELDPLRSVSITTHRDKGERVEGYFTVRDGNEEIEFKIEDPYGTAIYDAGIVKSRRDFCFTTEFEGVYTYFFGNYQSNSGKTIFLTEQRVFTRGLDLAIVGIGVGILILGFAGFYEDKLRQSRKQISET